MCTIYLYAWINKRVKKSRNHLDGIIWNNEALVNKEHVKSLEIYDNFRDITQFKLKLFYEV